MISSLEIVQYTKATPSPNGASPFCGVGRFPEGLSGRDIELFAGLLRAFVPEHYNLLIERRDTAAHDAVMRYLSGCRCIYHLQEGRTRRLKVAGLFPRFEEVAEVQRMWLQMDYRSLCGFLERFWPGTQESGFSFMVIPRWVTPSIWALQNAGQDGLRQTNGVLVRLDQTEKEYLQITSDVSRIRIVSLLEHYAITVGLNVTYVKK